MLYFAKSASILINRSSSSWTYLTLSTVLFRQQYPIDDFTEQYLWLTGPRLFGSWDIRHSFLLARHLLHGMEISTSQRIFLFRQWSQLLLARARFVFETSVPGAAFADGRDIVDCKGLSGTPAPFISKMLLCLLRRFCLLLNVLRIFDQSKYPLVLYTKSLKPFFLSYPWTKAEVRMAFWVNEATYVHFGLCRILSNAT